MQRIAAPKLVFAAQVVRPEEEGVPEGAAGTGDMFPGCFTGGEDETVDGALEYDADDLGAGKTEGRVLDVVIRIQEAVVDEGDDPHEDVNKRVEEEESNLVQRLFAALAQLLAIKVGAGTVEEGPIGGFGREFLVAAGMHAVADMKGGRRLHVERLDDAHLAAGAVVRGLYGGSEVWGDGGTIFV